MTDRRPFAKIDTGYHMNMKWYQIQRAMQDAMPNAMPNAIRNAMRLCRDAHHASILYCRQNGTDGIFPVAAIKILASILDDDEDAALTFLFDSGMWINHPGGMAEVRDYLEHQTPSDEMKNRSDAARKAAEARWSKHAKRNAERIDDVQCREEERRGENLTAEFDAWYQAYPKKVGKGDALKAFKTAMKKIDLETLITATNKYAASMKGQDKKYIKNPGPWLRDERWSDETTPTAGRAYDPWEEAS